MMRRLRQLLSAGQLSEDGFVEITAIYNNVAYAFLYLESNETHIDYSTVLPWRRLFYEDRELDAQLLSAVRALRCFDSEVERSREAFVEYLQQRREAPESAARDEMDDLMAREKALLAESEQAQSDFLGRLGVCGPGRPSVPFYKLVSSTADPTKRRKLTTVWIRVRDRNLDDLVTLVDETIAVRRRNARDRGYDTPLAATLTRSRVDESTAATYLDQYLELAMESHRRLTEKIGHVLGTDGDVAADFGFYVRQIIGPTLVPTFDLSACLDFAFAAAQITFGLVLRRVPTDNNDVIVVDAERDGEHVGKITFDLWDDERRSRLANTTRGLRNRTEWGEIVQYPVAYVACRFRHDGEAQPRINFQNMHSLFHETGHAVNHLLIRRRLPNQSGLEYLPLERLENLSMWFEKWVYHPDFATYVAPDENSARGLATAQRVKFLEYQRTHVDRAVTAALDFEAHRDGSGGLSDAFDKLDERWRISQYCSLGDFPPYFTWPMFQANPGANFAYLWGAADSAAKFEPLMARPLTSVGSDPTDDLFAPCFDFELPSEPPDPTAVFRFYDRPFAPIGRTS